MTGGIVQKNHDDGAKKIVDATIGEYFNALRRSKWSNNLKTALCQEFLAEEDVDNTFMHHFRLSEYEKNILVAVFDEYMAGSGFKVARAFEIVDQDLRPFEYKNMETGHNIHKKVIDEGTLFLHRKTDGVKLVFTLETYSHDLYDMAVSARKEHTAVAEAFALGAKKHGEENNYLKAKKITPDLSFLEINPSYNWDSVILDEATTNRVRRNIELLMKNLPIYEANRVPFKRGLILKGMPGVGKTLIGKILCNVAPCSVVWVTPRHLESSREVGGICSLVRNLAPAILFLEDIDLYGAERESNASKTILGELMNQLDGVEENKNVIVVATTNRGGEVEKALRNRPGRFDEVIEIKAPEKGERERMLRFYSEKFTCGNVNFVDLAEKTENYTGAHIKDLVNLAVMTAIEQGSYDPATKKITLTHEHMEKNIKLVKKRKIDTMGFGAPLKKESTENPPPWYDDD